MAVSNATTVVAAWLVQTLEGDSALMALISTVEEDMDVDQAVTYPFALFALQDALDDTYVVGDTPVFANPIYEIRVVDRSTSYARARAAYARIAALIDSAGGIIVKDAAGVYLGQIVSCVRKTPLHLPEAVGSVAFRSEGGLYQFQVA